MTRFYDLDDANAAVPELDGIVARARRAAGRAGPPARRGPGRGGGTGEAPRPRSPSPIGRAAERPAEAPPVDDLRLTRSRMQGLIDQMAAGVARIDALGLTLRDIEHGLVDFPALVVGPPGVAVLAARRAVDRLVARARDRVLGRRPLAELA